MRKSCIVFIALLFCISLFAACQRSPQGFVSDDAHCVLTLPQAYELGCMEDDTVFRAYDELLISEEVINGQRRKEGYRYYNMPKGTSFNISTVNAEENGEKTLLYWKMNDTLYKERETALGISYTLFTCTEDAVLDPVYCELSPVGILLCKNQSENDELLTAPEKSLFDEEGAIKEQEDIFYFYQDGDFSPAQDDWLTNIALKNYNAYSASAENDSYSVRVTFERSSLSVAGSSVIIHTLYKTEEYGFVTYSAATILQSSILFNDWTTHRFSLGKNTIEYKFN